MSIISRILAFIRGLFIGPMTYKNLEISLERRALASAEKLDWRHSIVDLMKLTNQDSSLEARKKLARELGYPKEPDGSAEMNIWLHKQVMEQLAHRGDL
jgi:hypothetical protein